MRGNGNIIRKFTAMLLAICMIIPTSGVFAFAEATNDAAVDTAVSEADTAISSEDTESIEDVSEENEAEAQSDEKTEETQSDTEKDSVQPDEPASEEASTEQSIDSMPAQSMKAETDEMEILASWDENIFPEDVTMVVRKIDSSQIKDAARELVSEDQQIVDAIAVDITFYTFADGKRQEIQPVDPAGVHVTLKAKRAIDGEYHQVIHVGDDGEASLITDAGNRDAQFDSVGFSVYAIIGSDGKQASDVVRRTYIFEVEGEEFARQTVKNGDNLVEPAIPVAREADNYFIGWFLEGTDTELTFGTVSDIGTGDDEEVTVVARFFEEFTVTFYGKKIGGERPILEIETGDTGDTVSTKGIMPQALSGSEELVGWSEDENASTATYGLDDEITIGTSDMKLYPVIRSVRKIEFLATTAMIMLHLQNL